jgi:hypothetical protein
MVFKKIIALANTALRAKFFISLIYTVIYSIALWIV